MKRIFIGREKELATLREMLGKLKVGSTVAPINFYGEAGIGKTSLLKKIAVSAPSLLPAIYIDLSGKTHLEFFTQLSEKIEESLGQKPHRTLSLISRIQELSTLEHNDNSDNITERTMLRKDIRELIELMPSTVSNDIEEMIRRHDFIGFAILIDNIDSNEILLPEFILELKRKRLVLISASEKLLPIDNVENQRARPLTKSDFYRFLRMKGLSITPAQDPPEFTNATVLIPFWANLLAEILKAGIFPEGNINLVKDDLAQLYLSTIADKQTIVDELKKGKTDLIEPLIDQFSVEVRIADAFKDYVIEEQRPISPELVSQLLLNTEIDRPVDETVIKDLLGAPENLLKKELLRRTRKLFHTARFRKLRAQNAIENSDNINDITVNALDLIDVYIAESEYRNAKDLLSTITAKTTYHSLTNATDLDANYAKCFLVYQRTRLSSRRDYEKTLSELDTLILYWQRMEQEPVSHFFDLETREKKAKLLLELGSESTIMHLKTTVQNFAKENDPYSLYLKSKLYLYLSNISENEEDILKYQNAAMSALDRMLKHSTLDRGSRIPTKITALLEIAEKQLREDLLGPLERTLFLIDKLVKEIEHPDRFPQIMFLWGKTLMFSGLSLKAQNKNSQAAKQLGLASDIIEQFPNKDYLLGKIYYQTADANEKMREFRQALIAYQKAEAKARSILRKGEDENLFELLGTILIKKGKALNILGESTPADEALREGINIYQFLYDLKSNTKTALNLAQSVLYRATIKNENHDQFLKQLRRALEILEKEPYLPEKAQSIITAIASAALRLFNQTIDHNDFTTAMKATKIAARSTLLSDNQKLKHNTITLIRNWENFPLSEPDRQILTDYLQKIDK